MWTMLFRALPGPVLVRLLLMAVIIAALVAVLFGWVFPWAESTIGPLGPDPGIGPS